ncbi:portal protein, partial [Trabulsiella guamensis ATCC 49490]
CRDCCLLGFLASREECRRYELHRLYKPNRDNKRNARPDEADGHRQLRITRGLKNQRGLL